MWRHASSFVVRTASCTRNSTAEAAPTILAFTHFGCTRAKLPSIFAESEQVKVTEQSWHLVQVLAEWTAQYGPIYKWNLTGIDLLVITDPEEVIKLSSREMNLPKAALFYNPLNTVRFCMTLGDLIRHAWILCWPTVLIPAMPGPA